MKEELITFETAELAKEKSFDLRVNNHYDLDRLVTDTILTYSNKENITGWCSVPTQSLLQKWLREEHDILLFVNYRKYAVVNSSGYYFHIGYDVNRYVHGKFETYEEALEAGLQIALELIK